MKQLQPITLILSMLLIACSENKSKDMINQAEKVQAVETKTDTTMSMISLMKEKSEAVLAINVLKVFGGVSTDLSDKYIITALVSDSYKGSNKKNDTISIKIKLEPNHLKDKDNKIIFHTIPFKENENYIVFLKGNAGSHNEFILLDEFLSVQPYDDYLAFALKSN